MRSVGTVDDELAERVENALAALPYVRQSEALQRAVEPVPLSADRLEPLLPPLEAVAGPLRATEPE